MNYVKLHGSLKYLVGIDMFINILVIPGTLKHVFETQDQENKFCYIGILVLNYHYDISKIKTVVKYMGMLFQ